MKSDDFYNPQNAGPGVLGQSQGNNREKNLKPVRHALYAGGLYWAWAVADAFGNAALYGTPDAAVPAALFRTLLVLLPTALMFFRKGFISAMALVGLCLTNTLGHFIGWMSDDPTTGLVTMALHLGFAAAFARAAFALRPVKALP